MNLSLSQSWTLTPSHCRPCSHDLVTSSSISSWYTVLSFIGFAHSSHDQGDNSIVAAAVRVGYVSPSFLDVFLLGILLEAPSPELYIAWQHPFCPVQLVCTGSHLTSLASQKR